MKCSIVSREVDLPVVTWAVLHATGPGLPANEVIKHLDALAARGAVRSGRRGDEVYYERVRGRRRRTE